MRGRFAIIGILLLLTACYGPAQERPTGTLPAVAGAPYRVSLRTYDNGYCDSPFALHLESAPPTYEGEKPGEILRSGNMCRNVDVIQTPDRLYVFYEVLSIRSFYNTPLGSKPRVILCDLALEACRDQRARLLAEGGKAYNVCTCRVPKAPEVIEPFPSRESVK